MGNTLRKIMAWTLILAMVLGNNAVSIASESSQGGAAAAVEQAAPAQESAAALNAAPAAETPQTAAPAAQQAQPEVSQTAPKAEAAAQEQTAPKAEGAAQEQAASKAEAGSQEQAAPKGEAAAQEQAVPKADTTGQEQGASKPEGSGQEQAASGSAAETAAQSDSQESKAQDVPGEEAQTSDGTAQSQGEVSASEDGQEKASDAEDTSSQNSQDGENAGEAAEEKTEESEPVTEAKTEKAEEQEKKILDKTIAIYLGDTVVEIGDTASDIYAQAAKLVPENENLESVVYTDTDGNEISVRYIKNETVSYDTAKAEETGFSGETRTVFTSDESASGAYAPFKIGEGASTVNLTVKTEEKFEKGTLKASGADYTVVMNYEADAKIPAGASLKVREITPSTAEYEIYLGMAGNAISGSADAITSARFFDIKIVKKNGEEMEPSAPVSVRISYGKPENLDGADKVDVDVVHIADESNAAEVVDTSNTTNRMVSFEAGEFSIYGVLYTVIFTYEGYSYTMKGEGSVLLSALAKSLNLYETGVDRAFDLANVESVEFSDSSLLEVTAAEGDWVLRSLASFTTKETLTITMNNESKFMVEVTDPPSPESSDLSDFVREAIIQAPKNDEGEYVITPGETYNVKLQFAETQNGLQFPDDGTTMTYNLPAGFAAVDHSGTFNIRINDGGTEYVVSGNTYSVAGGVVSVNFNTSDPNYSEVTGSGNVRFTIDIEGEFDETVTIIDFGNEVTKEVEIDISSSVTSSKVGQVDKENNKIYYTVNIQSQGISKDIVVQDTITGEGLTLDAGSFNISSNKRESVAGSSNVGGNSFTYTIPEMRSGEVITFRYAATIDPSIIEMMDGKVVTVAENTVKVSSEGQPTPDTSNVKHTIDYTPTVDKSGKIVAKDGDTTTIEWTIVANEDQIVSMAGGKITDEIAEASRDIMSYFGDGITVKVSDKAGSTVRTDNVAWSALTGKTDSGWTYIIPATDAGKAYKYEITYRTTVNTKGLLEPKAVGNTVKTDGGKTGESSVNIGPEKPDIKKTATKLDLDNQEVTWTVDIEVPTGGFNKAVVTDTYPTIDEWNTGTGYAWYEAVKNGSVSITGLVDGESWDIEYNETDAVITFYQDAGKTTPGLKSGSVPRTVTITLKTEIEDEWVEHSREVKWQAAHVNNVKLDYGATVETKAEILIQSQYVNKSALAAGTRTDENGVELPIYKYFVNLSGVNSSSIVIEDHFDTTLLEPYTAQWEGSDNGYIWGGDQYTWNKEKGSVTVPYLVTADGLEFHTNADCLPVSDSGFYQSYRLTYFLTVKDAAALEKIVNRAATSENGTYQMDNTASWDGKTSTGTVTYTYDGLTKELLTDPAELSKTDEDIYVKFRITANPGAVMLHDGAPIELTDTVTNLSVIITDVNVVEPASGVTYDMTGNTLTFIIPDQTKVVIEYRARVIYDKLPEEGKTEKITFKNDVKMLGYEKSISGDSWRTNNASGIGDIPSIRLLKYEAGNMGKTLAGAQFALLDSSKNPILDKDNKPVTFTTGADGLITVRGAADTDGWTLAYDTLYYLRETVAPPGYKLADFLYSFTISEDGSTDYLKFKYHTGDTMSAKNYPGTDVIVEKAWSDGDEKHTDDTVTVKLQQQINGGEWSDDILEEKNSVWTTSTKTIELGESSEWKGAFNGLPLKVPADPSDANSDDVPVSYRVIETHVNDNKVVYTGDDLTQGTYDGGKVLISSTAPSASAGEAEAGGAFTFTITNTTTRGSLKLKKIVTVNGEETTSDLADGTYTFTISGPAPAEGETVGTAMTADKTVTITIENGAIVSATGGDLGDDGYVEVKDLDEGTYTVTEDESTNPAGMKLASDNNVEVTVAAGKSGAEVTAKAEFTNNIDVVDIEVDKKWVNADGSDDWPAGVTASIQLTADGTAVTGKTAALSSDQPSYKFSSLPKYKADGRTEIVYSVEEVEVAGYESEVGELADGKITVTNTQETGSLIIEKNVTVEGAETSGTAADGTYLFTVTNQDGEAVANVSITIVNGESNQVPVGGLVPGTYTVSEVEDFNRTGISLTSGNDLSIEVQAGEKAAVKTAAFTNNYETVGEVEIGGVKTLEGRTLNEGEFTFELRDASGTAVKTASNAADGSFSFGKIAYTGADLDKDADGNYIATTKTYTVVETAGQDTSVIYDKTQYTVTVTLIDDGKGIINTVKNPADAAAISFVNTYEANGTITFGGRKTMEGKSLKAGDYSFELKDGAGGLIQKVSNAADGTYSFDPIVYTLDDLDKVDGEYVKTTKIYTVSEVKGSDAAVKYDTNVYRISVTLEDKGSNEIEVISSAAPDACNFTNTYETKGETTISVVKALEGRPLEAGEFSFDLYEQTATAKTLIETVSNAADGTVSFSTLKYTGADLNTDADGNYIPTVKTYTVKEKSVRDPSITIDAEEYSLTVTLTDDGNGTINTVKDPADSEPIVITNTYGTKGDVTLGGVKTLEGRALKEGEFSFELYEVDGETETLKETVSNAADGSFAFTKIEYTGADLDKDTDGNYVETTKTYKVKEKAGTDTTVTYDKTEYTVTVTLTDDGNGSINVVKDPADNAAVSFTNTYEAKGEITFGGTKTMEGRTLKEDEYSFELREVDGENETLKETVTNAADGSYSFTTIEYTLADLETDESGGYLETTKVYTVSEKAGTEKAVTYDDTVYTITVTLKDKGDSTIEVTTDEVPGACNFTNTYETKGEITFSGTKEIAGYTMKAGEFTFELYDLNAAGVTEADGGKTAAAADKPVQSVTNAADGSYSFAKIEYTGDDLETDKDGNYIETTKKYKVVEKAGSNTDISYDDTEYEITVTLKDDGKGKIEASADPAENSFKFVNKVVKEPEFKKKIMDTNDSTGETSGWQDSADYDIGDPVPYRLSAVLASNVTDYRQYHITFHDEMELGLTFNGITGVTVNGADAAYTLDGSTAQSFDLTLTWGGGTEKITDTSLNGAEVVVYFTSILNEKANLGSEGNVNAAKLEYSCNPSVDESGIQSSETDETPYDYVIAFTYKMDVNKVDPEGNPLTGAAFKLEKKLAAGGTTPVAQYIPDSTASTFSFKGLDDGEYILTETRVPTGHKRIEPITFTVSAQHLDTWEVLDERRTILASLTGDEPTGAVELDTSAAAGELTGNVVNEEISLVLRKVEVVLDKTGSPQVDEAGNEIHKPLSGATFTLSLNGTVLQTWVTDGNDIDFGQYLEYGDTYILREAQTPEGYIGDIDGNQKIIDHEIVVADDGTITVDGEVLKDGVIEIVNTPEIKVTTTTTTTEITTTTTTESTTTTTTESTTTTTTESTTTTTTTKTTEKRTTTTTHGTPKTGDNTPVGTWAAVAAIAALCAVMELFKRKRYLTGRRK